MGQIRIVSDGTPQGTQILLPDGSPMDGVTRVEWSLAARGRGRAVIEVEGIGIPIDVQVEDPVIVQPESA